jgi:methyl-accepting chemotaxis protein
VALVFFTGIAMVSADFLLLIFFGHSFSHLIFRFSLSALVFLVIYIGVLGLRAKCFAPAYFKNIDENEFFKRLKNIGAVPIKMIAMNVVLHAIFLGVIFFAGNYLGIDPVMRSPLFLASLAFGMLVGTFIYVVCDGLVSGTLLMHNFTIYPRDLRENRQSLKAMIVPLAAVIMALVFSCSITMLGIRMAGGSLDEMQTREWSTVLLPIFICFICVVFLSLNLKKNTALIYSSIIEEMENLSSAHKDLTRRITVCSVDELGTFAGMVNTFCDYLGNGMRDIKGGQKELSVTGHKMEENASSMANSIDRISKAAENILVKTQSQLENAKTSSSAVHKISDHIKSLEESVAIQTTSMSQASSAVEEMVGNISSIGSVTEKMASQFKTVGEAAEKGSSIQRESSERVREIVTQSQTLQEANKIISTIASQTNLLAMNAAIEAAHAGEAGRGFSVVADEIRKLAENSSVESKKISNELKQIVNTIDKIVKDSEASGKAFAEVSNRIDETGRLVIEVDNAVREQKTGADQVMDSLKVMNDITAKVSHGSNEMGRGAEEIVREIDALQISAGEIESRMEEVSDNIKNLNTGAQEVTNLAGDTRSSIHKISEIADGFEV